METTPKAWPTEFKRLRGEDHPVAFWLNIANELRLEKRRIPEFVLRRARLWFTPSWRKLGIPEGH